MGTAHGSICDVHTYVLYASFAGLLGSPCYVHSWLVPQRSSGLSHAWRGSSHLVTGKVLTSASFMVTNLTGRPSSTSSQTSMSSTTTSAGKYSASTISEASSGRSVTPSPRDVTECVGQPFTPFNHGTIASRMEGNERMADDTLDRKHLFLFATPLLSS